VNVNILGVCFVFDLVITHEVCEKMEKLEYVR